MRVTTTLVLLTALVFASASASAEALFRITEIYPGVSGPDGTNDWFEITNFGSMPGDTGTLTYDDSSGDPNDEEAGVLDSFILAPGKSAVFLTSVEPGDIDDFVALWGPGINVGNSNSDANLNSSDTVNIYETSTGDLLDSLDVAPFGGSIFTVERLFLDTSTARQSVFGENGAYVSATFMNDEVFEGVTDTIALTGSPGRIPEPASLMLFLAAGLGVLGRNRR